MHEHHGTARGQLRPQWIVGRVAQVAATGVGQQDHTVGAQFVQGADGLGDRAVEVRQRKHGEVPEAVRGVFDQFRLEVVGLASQLAGRGALGAGPPA